MKEKKTAKRTRGRPKGFVSDCRKRLLDAGLEIFCDQGHDGASLRAIAAKAKCDVSMIAHYFGSKTELWIAIIEELAERVDTDQLIQNLDGSAGPLEKRIETGIGMIFDFVEKNSDIVRFMMREMVEPADRQKILTERLMAPALNAFIPLWQETIDEGVFGINDPLVIHNALFGAILLLVLSAPMFSHTNQKPIELNRIKRALVQELLGRRAARLTARTKR